MGVKDLFQLLQCKTVKWDWFRGKVLAVDALYKIHQCSLAHKNVNVLSANGHPTLYLQVLLQFALNLKKHCSQQIWVFDSRNSLKHEEVEKRRAARNVAQQRMQTETDAAERIKYERRAFSVSPLQVENVKRMLDWLGIPWCVAPADIEAEQLAAQMCQGNHTPDWLLSYVDGVITSDADALLFGATNILRKNKSSSAKFDLYNLEDNLQALKLTQDDLIKVGLVLGTDFAAKTPRIGVKTVMAKFKGLTLTPEQQHAFDHVFKKRVEAEAEWSVLRDPDYASLREWLVATYQFNPANLDRIFARHRA